MKKEIINWSLVRVVLLLVASVVIIPQSLTAAKESLSISDTLVKYIDVSPDCEVAFVHRGSDVVFIPWEKNLVKIETIVELEGDKIEDVEAVLKALGQISIMNSPDYLKVKTQFYKERKCNFKYKYTLLDGKKAVLNRCTITYKVYLPKSAFLKLDCRYCDVRLGEMENSFEAKFYNVNLLADHLDKGMKIEAKYSEIIMQSAGSTACDLYNTTLNLKRCGDFELTSHYSKINISEAEVVDIQTSYNDNIRIKRSKSISVEGKYSDLEIESTGDVEAEFYSADFRFDRVGNLNMESSYSEIEGQSVQQVTLQKNYNTDIKIDSALSVVSLDTKYGQLSFLFVAHDIRFVGYNTSLNIADLGPDFKTISVEGKYSKVNIDVPEALPFLLALDLVYGDLSYPSDEMTVQTYIKEQSKLEVKAYYRNPDTENVIACKGSSMTINIGLKRAEK